MSFAGFKNARVVRSSWLEEGGRRLIVTPRDYQWMPDTVEEVDA